jgi:hypothetical protein
MQMSKLTVRLLAAAIPVIAAAALLASASPASADSTTNQTVGAIRIGAFNPTNANTRRDFGLYDLEGGLDYTFQQTGLSERANVSIDFLETTKHGNELQTIPVTIGQQVIGGARSGGVREYVGYGIGAYFEHFNEPGTGNFNGSSTHNQVAYGGFLNAGLDLTTNLFIDARYHIVTPVKNINTDGIELTAGVRF